MNRSDFSTAPGVFQHPLWLAGFRPLFLLGFLAAIFLPLQWAAWHSGVWGMPGSLSPTQWHAHEMLFGFGWAILGGFLLTASKNWVNIRGLHGAPLFLAALLWMIERVVILYFPELNNDTPLLTHIFSYCLASLYMLFVGGYVVWTLVRFRKQDSFKDNYFFMIALPLFLCAKWLLLTPSTWVEGYSLALGLFRVAFVVMFERTMTQFMKNARGILLLRNQALDLSIKVLVLLSVLQAFLPPKLAMLVMLCAAIMLMIRYLAWKPLAGLSRFDTGTMYAGYLGLMLHLALDGLRTGGLWTGFGTASIHVFSFLCMGIIIPAMMIRICQGHTGRKILFTSWDRIAIGCVGVGAFFRIVAPALWPGHYLAWIILAATGWSLCFALVGCRLAPFLWQARVDGREH